MNKVVLFFLFVIVLSPVEGMAEDIEGFRGIRWGTNINSLAGFIYQGDSSKSDDTRSYKKTDDQLSIGAANIDSITYLFWRDRLSVVLISYTGLSNFSALKAALDEKYGSSVRLNRFLNEYLWDRASGAAMIKINDVSKDGSIYMFSHELQKERMAAEKLKAKEGAKKDL